ncbi:MAG: tetratricopeptide repeat protein [Planctomycetota bacterium]
MGSVHALTISLAIFIGGSASAGTPQDPVVSTLEQAFSNGDYHTALKIGRTLLAQDPNDLQTLLMCGASCIELARGLTDRGANIGAHKEALTYFERLVRLDPNHGQSRVHQSLARCHLVLASHVKALGHAKLAVQLDSASAMAQRLLGESWQQNGNPSNALIAFKAAHQLEPGSADYLEAVQDQLHKMRRFGESLQYIEKHRGKVLSDPKNQSTLHWCLHVALLSLNKVHRAHEAIIKAHDLTPDEPRLLSSLAVSYYRVGDFEKSENWCDQTLAHRGTPPRARAVAQRTKGQILMHQNQYAKAKPLLESALTVLEGDGTTMLALISTLRRLGETEQAKAVANQYRKSVEKKSP